MRKQTTSTLVSVLCVAALTAQWPSPAHTATFCKDGHVHGVPGQIHYDRTHAEASAVRQWRQTQAKSIGEVMASNLFVPRANLKCMRLDGEGGWRCYVKMAKCITT